MKHLMLFLISISSLTSTAQSDPIGAWQKLDQSGNTHLLIITEGFFSQTVYSTDAFVETLGGSWEASGNRIEGILEYRSSDANAVGQRIPLLAVEGWSRIDEDEPGRLAGAWLITGRMRDGEIRERKPGARKTMKILSGSKFQWIAYNVDTGEFFGTGGGTYTAREGKYIENIEFFSRDQSRVGASLDFNFEVKEGKWHHSGKSSKGSDIYEIWSPR